MPYGANRQRCVPTSREMAGAEFAHANGTVDAHGSYAQVVGPTPDADIDKRIIDRKVELSCGCYWPDAPVAGVCAECAAAGGISNVCVSHFVVCSCGTPCCWRHSHEVDQSTRICTRCCLRAKNQALKESIRRGVVGLIRSLVDSKE